jgi:hypothetical protein
MTNRKFPLLACTLSSMLLVSAGCSDSTPDPKPFKVEDLKPEDLASLSKEEFQLYLQSLSDVELEHLEAMNMDDGPFKGKLFEADFQKLSADEVVPFHEGDLLIFNRSEIECPVMAFRNKDSKIEWSVAMDPSLNKGYEDNHLIEITGCVLSSKSGREILHYTANWDYGHEHGYTYFDSEGGFRFFYLSW